MVSRRMSALYPHILVWLFIIASCGYFLYNINRFINFGIDLVGGTYITLHVQVDKAHEYEIYNISQSIVEQLQHKNMATPTERSVEGTSVEMRFTSEDEAQRVSSYLMTDADVQNVNVSKKESSVTVTLEPAYAERIANDAVQRDIGALNGRIQQQFGAAETSVVPHGDDKIIVELPNVHNLEQAKSIIGKAALLEIKPVIDTASTRQALLDTYDYDLPEGTQMYPGRDGGYFLLSKYAELTGRSLESAEMQLGGSSGAQAMIGISWDRDGAKKFAELTREHVGEPLAIVIDNEVVSAPNVNNAIEDGTASITGRFTPEQAKQQADLLKSGAFAAPVEFVEERHIGPELGQEAIMQGLIACGISLALLFLFSVIVYKTAGIFAFIVLICNLIAMLVMFASVNATLTLPGIAGMVLTVGMAIDASILIYERIKEELAEGQSLRKAIESGFSGATSVILDANITHLLISIVLYGLGTGPIQGFGVSMIVGIIATLLTGLWMLRYIFKVLTDVAGVNTISI